METLKLNAYAKINLGLDVIGRLPNGYHEVKMIMQSVGSQALTLPFVTPCVLGLALMMLGAHMWDCPKDAKLALRFGGVEENDAAWKALHRFAGWLWLAVGLLVAALTIAAYLIGHYMESGAWALTNSPDGMTMAFLTMSMCEIFHAFNMRSQRKSIFSLKSHNKVLWAAMIGSLLLTTAVLEIPFLADAFGFTPVDLTEYSIALALAILVIPVVEIVKLIQRKTAKK